MSARLEDSNRGLRHPSPPGNKRPGRNFDPVDGECQTKYPGVELRGRIRNDTLRFASASPLEKGEPGFCLISRRNRWKVLRLYSEIDIVEELKTTRVVFFSFFFFFYLWKKQGVVFVSRVLLSYSFCTWQRFFFFRCWKINSDEIKIERKSRMLWCIIVISGFFRTLYSHPFFFND